MEQDETLTMPEVMAVLAEAGRPMARNTWSAYVSRGAAPAPVRWVVRSPLWSRADVEQWVATRRRRAPGSPDATRLE